MSQGKRAGSRKGARQGLSLGPGVLGLAAGITLAVIAWGFLVFTAIRFGVSARDGESGAWGWLALATLGAMACLFIGMMLAVRLSRALGITASPSSSHHAAEHAAQHAAQHSSPHGGSHAGAPSPPAAASDDLLAGPEVDNPYLDHLLHGARPTPAPPPGTRPPGGHRA